jgi:anti-sigma factor RsiW
MHTDATHIEWTDRLSALLDGELDGAERAAVLQHLAQCGACSAVLEELKTVVTAAGQLGECPPREDLWPAVQAGIERTALGPRLARTSGRPAGAATSSRRVWLKAASIALTLLTGGTLWWALAQPRGDAPAQVAGTLSAPGGVNAVAAEPGEFGRTSAAIAELERSLAESRARLDPETVRVIEQNLAVIDAAIEEVRRALAEDPGSTYLNLHMADTMRRKLQLLQDVGSLAARSL